MDGTILESADVWFELLKDCVKHFGHPELTYDHWRQFFGQSMQKNVERFMPGSPQDAVDKYCEDNYSRFLHKMHVLPGAEDVVAFCAKVTNNRISIVTNCPGPITLQTLAAPSALGLYKGFGGQLTSSGGLIPSSLLAVCADDRLPPVLVTTKSKVALSSLASAHSSSSTSSSSSSSSSSSASAVVNNNNNNAEVKMNNDDAIVDDVVTEEKQERTVAPGGPVVMRIAPKPDTMMLEEAARRLGVSLSECIMVGDSKFDMMAGKSAGCFCVGIKVGGGDVQIDSIADLLKIGDFVEFSQS